MKDTSVSFENISDIYAFRVICKDVSDCYRVLGDIHKKWPMIASKFKDYISTPKANGYSLIHLCYWAIW